MRRVMVRYQLKADRVAENEQYIAAVFAELERTAPAGLHYATFRLPDGVSVMHLAAMSAEVGNPLMATAAFRRFVEANADRCVEPPVTTELALLGAYRMFAS